MSTREDIQQKEKKVRFYESWTFLILFCIAVPILIRSFLYTPFHIPSGSMKPTLLVGDYIFVAKYAYGYSRYSFPLAPNLFSGRKLVTEPERGDVIVFRLPTDPSVDYIKRLIGMPGDRIQVRGGNVILNGKPIPRKRIENFEETQRDGSVIRMSQYIETLPEGRQYRVLDERPNGGLDNTEVYTVPTGHYFFMGDNRDNSQDSRVLSSVGFVPAENLVGRAEMIFVSTRGALWHVWNWMNEVRSERAFSAIK